MLVFIMGNDSLISKQVRSQASRLDPTCLHKHECGAHTERLKELFI